MKQFSATKKHEVQDSISENDVSLNSHKRFAHRHFPGDVPGSWTEKRI